MQDAYVFFTPGKKVICVTNDLGTITESMAKLGVSCEGEDDIDMTLYVGTGIKVGSVHKTFMAD